MEQLPEGTYFEAHAEELLRNAGLTKAKFSERMGVARQNIQKVFTTKNVLTLMKAAEILGTDLNTLIYGQKEETAIDGFIEVNGTIHRLRCKADIEGILLKI